MAEARRESRGNGVTWRCQRTINGRKHKRQISIRKGLIDFLVGNPPNGVELLWKNAKMKMKAISGTSREKLPSYLDEFKWRKVYGKKTIEAFDNINIGDGVAGQF